MLTRAGTRREIASHKFTRTDGVCICGVVHTYVRAWYDFYVVCLVYARTRTPSCGVSGAGALTCADKATAS